MDRGESGWERDTAALLMRSWISCSLMELALCPKVVFGSSSISSPKTWEPLVNTPEPRIVLRVPEPPANHKHVQVFFAGLQEVENSLFGFSKASLRRLPTAGIYTLRNDLSS